MTGHRKIGAGVSLAAALFAGAVSVPLGAGAQGLRAVEPIPGYVCMELNATEQQMRDPNFQILVRRAPAPDAPVLGTAGATVAVAEAVAPVNGYLRTLFPNGEAGWIAQRDVRPWRSPSGSVTARCIPSLMSNGRPGFTTTR